MRYGIDLFKQWGQLARGRGRLVALRGVVCALYCLWAMPAGAEQIQLIAAGTTRAIIEIDGKRIVLTIASPQQDGVTLLRTGGGEVVVEYYGEEITLSTEQNYQLVHKSAAVADDAREPVVLWADNYGAFIASGMINGRAVEFLVDTGADLVTLSGQQATQLGIDYAHGEDSYASTASGVTTIKILRADTISIGHITRHNIQFSVIPGHFPEIPLLGSSFLSALNMLREGDRMELRAR